jgi:hypothetical protein
MHKNSLVLPLLLPISLLIGCNSARLCSAGCEDQPESLQVKNTGWQPLHLGAGELQSLKDVIVHLPAGPGSHIDVSATDGRLQFHPDNNAGHLGAGKPSIAIDRFGGQTQRATVVVSPEAAAILRQRTASH